jgi:hypothetical protein
MEKKGRTRATPASETVITLVRGEDRFDAVVTPVPRSPAGTHELRYLWNRRPFITRVFKRGAFAALLDSVRALQQELMGRGWRLADPQAG